MITNNYSNISFTSDEHREAQLRAIYLQREIERQQELERQRELQRQRELERQREQERLRQIELQRQREEQQLKKEINTLNDNLNTVLQYKGLSDPACDNMAAFMLNFSCSMLMDSEHDLREFFGTETEAEELRKNLSPECQKTSTEIRNELMQLKMTEDPVFGLISINRLKDYMPEEGILSDEQYKVIADTAKYASINLINQADYDDFEEDEKASVKELVKIAENTEGLDFGDDYNKKLSALIDKINRRKNPILNNCSCTQTFIPPVQVRYQDEEIIRDRDIQR